MLNWSVASSKGATLRDSLRRVLAEWSGGGVRASGNENENDMVNITRRLELRWLAAWSDGDYDEWGVFLFFLSGLQGM